MVTGSRMRILVSAAAVIVLIDLALLGSGPLGLHTLFGIVIPYMALAIFAGGLIYRVVLWARSPVPFCIPTVCGQQKSLPWIKAQGTESPSSTWGVAGRMALEVLFFRSLFRNDQTSVDRERGRLVYSSRRLLWLAGLLFHWSFLVILLRHLRFFLEPVPSVVLFLQTLDSPFQIGLPTLFITDVLILAAVTYLFFRRAVVPHIRYISLIADYFALLLLGGVIISGILMRHVLKTDLLAAKALVTGLVTFSPSLPQGLTVTFYVHLFLVSFLVAYFPWSKLMHMGGVFLSPTRNLANDSRARRHVNPWTYPVRVHTYAEWEDDFRDAMKEVGLPVEKEN